MQYCSYMNDNIKFQQYVKEIKDAQKTEILYASSLVMYWTLNRETGV